MPRRDYDKLLAQGWSPEEIDDLVLDEDVMEEWQKKQLRETLKDGGKRD